MKLSFTLSATTTIMLSSLQRSAAFTARQIGRSRAISSTTRRYAEEGQAEVVLVGCGAPNRGKSHEGVFNIQQGCLVC
jgi:hypothetical protein